MARILIIGYGNPLRSDDGLGWHVANQLSTNPRFADDLIIAAHQLTPEMAEFASRAGLVIFIDAAEGGDPGTLRCGTVRSDTGAGDDSHQLSPATVLALAKELYGCCPPAYLVTIAGENFATGSTLSAAVLAAIPALLARIQELVDGAEAETQ